MIRTSPLIVGAGDEKSADVGEKLGSRGDDDDEE